MLEHRALGDARIAFEVTGQGPPLLLMHGAEASRQMFDALVPLLAPHFTVIACDQRDCGDTENPDRPATLAELADDAHALVQALGCRRAHVFGSSFGGRVAQAYALRHPQALDHLVLGSTWPLPDGLEDLNPTVVARLQVLRARLPESAEELAGVFFPEAFLAERPALRQFFAQVRPANDRSRRRAAAVSSSLDATPRAIAAPTLLLAGDLDILVPPALTFRLATLIAGSRTVLLPGIGHATALQAPREVAAQLIDFLTREIP